MPNLSYNNTGLMDSTKEKKNYTKERGSWSTVRPKSEKER
jgi:hypothetical protein